MEVLGVCLEEQFLLLLYKKFNIAESPKCDGYLHGRDPIAYKFSDKNSLGCAVTRADKSY